MKTAETKRNITVGVFVLIGALLFLIAVFFVGNNETLFQRSFLLNAKFKDAGGLQAGDNVWLTGVKIGTISEVDIEGDNTVRVALRIKKKYQPILKNEVVAAIGRDGVMGNRILLLTNGKTERPVVEGQFIASQSGNETSDIMETLKRSTENIQAITKNVKELTEEIESGKGIIGELITNEMWAKKFNTALTQMEITSENTAVVTGDISVITKEIKDNKTGLVGTLITDTTFSKIYKQSLANIHITSKNTANITGDFKTITDRLKEKNNAVGLILTDTAFARNLRQSATRLNEDLTAAQHSFLLKGYFKKKKK
jgi:phospholipid/cholesterol/gamma-HCH transport system substrate-binding protein